MTPSEKNTVYQSTLDDLTRANAAMAAILREDAERRQAQMDRRRNAGFVRRMTWNPLVQAAALFALAVLIAKYVPPFV